MAKDTKSTKNTDGNINQGVPEHRGLDEATRARLRAQADGGNDGIVVGSFADLQRGTVGDPTSAPLNPTVDAENLDLVTPAVNDAELGTETTETEREGIEPVTEETTKKSTAKK